MAEPKTFHLGDVLSVMTGKLVSPRHVDGLYDVCRHMAGESVFTHQLPRVSKEATPAILRQYPELAEVDASSVNRDNWQDWLAEQVERYGETISLLPMTKDEHESIDPMSEAAEMIHPDRIIPVVIGKPAD